ncbi:MAG: SDR family oxidoreductase [Pseudomonadota bacterium]|uniref:NAD(P)-dependent dehydrogenase (Short-subunit alcohol dehydrogenase family) n=1 Tax=Gallaecimonas pentaromativorans TaxID=584787 RepID=A0A3N1PCY0_9GAMM|nr:SDR family oxidoreductase [Gallaecimonas pentaromativorans]MED5523669.1 SDR family oxidoreductase [Pseudomonadota bacterium]ROQ24867.1 NAD(P)-dependent dehydrogenase (short-subunit alcohol dehydrogenase family) [Gallaecimonas pentaromativorans]
MHHHPIALITGGSRGLGRDTALTLAKRGVDIIITYHSNQQAADAVVAEATALGATAQALQLDTGNIHAFGAFKSQLSALLAGTWQGRPLNYLVNNAGTSLHVPMMSASESQFDEVMNVHVKGVFFLTQALVPLMADGGAIVHISSGLTRFTLPGSGLYGAMKGAVEVLSRYWAAELAARQIRVNTLAPGAIATDFSGGMVRDNPDVHEKVKGFTALGRVGQPEDIGKAVAMLLSNDSGWITGQRIEASGGMVL